MIRVKGLRRWVLWCVFAGGLLLLGKTCVLGTEGNLPHRYYGEIKVLAQRNDIITQAHMDFTALLKEKNVRGVFDENSIRVVEVDEQGKLIKETACNFIKDAGYDKKIFTAGRILWKAGKVSKEAWGKEPVYRYYRIYFDIEENGKKKASYDRSIKEANLLDLGDFEESNTKLYSKIGWVIRFDTKGFKIDNTVSHTGKSSLWVQKPKDRKGSWGAVSPLYRVKPGELYDVSEWRKIKDAIHPEKHQLGRPGWILVSGIQVYNKDNKQVDINRFSSESTKPTIDWQEARLIVRIPEDKGACFLRVYCSTYAKEGSVWYDDVKIVPLPKEIEEIKRVNRANEELI